VAVLSAAKHTPGPWQVSRDNDTTLTIVAPWSDKVRPGCEGWGDYRGIHTATLTHHSGEGAVPREHAEANARLIAAAPELLSELQKAHQIILNALALMTFEQKGEWARANSRDGCIGDGTTRYHERAEAIAKAVGGSATC